MSYGSLRLNTLWNISISFYLFELLGNLWNYSHTETKIIKNKTKQKLHIIKMGSIEQEIGH